MFEATTTTVRRSRSDVPWRDITPAILAGGLGTRLRSAVPDRPKPLAPVLERPFVAFVLDQLAQAGAKRVMLLTGHGASAIEQALGARYGGLELIYEREEEPRGTGGALAAALDRIDTPRILLLNGDSYCDVDLAALAQFHERVAADLSLVLVYMEETERFGRVEHGAAGQVTRFSEKVAGSGPGWVNAGVTMLERSLALQLPRIAPLSLERDVLPGWTATRKVHAFLSSGAFLDIGTPASYASAGAILKRFLPK